jgi:uncharacterized protein
MNLHEHINDQKMSVIVKPNAKKNEVLGYDEHKKAVRIAVKAVPDKGKANTALMKFVSKLLGVKVRIVSGKKNRTKILEILP